MGRAIGYVTQIKDGNYKGILTMGINEKIKIVPHESRTADSREPNYIVFGETMGEIGAAWDRTGKESGNEYVSVRLADPRICRHNIFANLGHAAEGEDNEYAMIWNAD